jgi:hypothetical protein
MVRLRSGSNAFWDIHHVFSIHILDDCGFLDINLSIFYGFLDIKKAFYTDF